MHTAMMAEGRRLEQDIDRLGRALLLTAEPFGLRQRARSAFIRQLLAYKCERLEAVRDALERGRTQRRSERNRLQTI